MNIAAKKVILIGGTSYTGSTLFELILANDKHGFACGEVQALFQPTRKHHIKPPCGCGNPSCTIWERALAAGENNFFEFLFKTFPDIAFIVASSKNVMWIREQSRLLKIKGYQVFNLLIYKSPNQFAYSFAKRNRLHQWERTWINYHLTYVNLIRDFRGVSYEAFVQNDTVLSDLCRVLGIENFESKRAYWNHTTHALFGNTSTKYHLYEPGSTKYQDEIQEIKKKTTSLEQDLMENYRSLSVNEIPQDFAEKFRPHNEIVIKHIHHALKTGIVEPSLAYSPLKKAKIILAYKVRKYIRKMKLVKLQDFKNEKVNQPEADA